MFPIFRVNCLDQNESTPCQKSISAMMYFFARISPATLAKALQNADNLHVSRLALFRVTSRIFCAASRNLFFCAVNREIR
jgi:hypothetical protein